MTEIRCPVMDCAWSTSTDLPAEVTDATLAGVFGWGVFRAGHEASKRHQVEAETRRHLQTHDVIDFVKTIKRLEELVASQVNQILELTGQQATYSLKGLAVDVDFEPKI